MPETSPVDATDLDLRLAGLMASPVMLLDGTSSRFKALVHDRPVVVAFVRHFGCLFCHEAVADVVAAIPRILARGARVIIVGNGSLNQARHFFQDKGLPMEGVTVVTDPDRETYNAMALNRSLASVFASPQAARAYKRARASGHRINGWFGDLTQLGGTVVIKPPGHATFFHRSKYAGDHADMNAVVAALGG